MGKEAFKKGIDKFFEDFNENSRGYAWYDCNAAFDFDSNNKLSSEEKAKELFIYLANWGMVSRRSFLMKHTWRILRETVEIFQNKDYKILRNPEISTIETNIDKLFELKEKINNSLCTFHEGMPVSDTLISKILLGALGCTVAYDKKVKDNLASKVGTYKTFNKESVLSLCNFYKSNEKYFDELRQEVKNRTDKECPPFKLLDLYLWSI